MCEQDELPFLGPGWVTAVPGRTDGGTDWGALQGSLCSYQLSTHAIAFHHSSSMSDTCNAPEAYDGPFVVLLGDRDGRIRSSR